jgi:DNA modification methylase
MTTVPAIRATDLTPEQVRAFRLADNQVATLSKWDYELLPLELSELQGAGFDWTQLGFDQDELAKLLGGEIKEGLTDPDSIPEPPDEAITQPGDLWILGEHRLLCGDSASAADVDLLLAVDPAKARELPAGSDIKPALLPIHLANTDPPYGVKVEPRSNNAIASGNSSFPAAERTHHQSFDVARQGEKKRTTQKMRAKDRPLVNDFVSEDEFNRLLHAWFGQIARVLLPGRAFYIWGGYANLGNYPGPLKAAGLYFSQGIVWDKQHPVLTRKDFMGAFEIAYYGWREGAAHVYLGPNNATDLWHVKKIPPQQMTHLTSKPAELAVRAIQYSSRAGENVLDLFGGSGSTLIAAEQTGRRCFMMEIDTLYSDIIVDRFQRFSGKPAILERTGTSPIPMKPREEGMR